VSEPDPIDHGTIDLEGRALPTRTAENAQFWDSCAAHAMELQKCDSCGRFWYYPSPICPHCSSLEHTWARVSGTGTVYSYTWVYRPAPGFESEVPYAYALVELDEGPIMATNVVGSSEDELAIGMAVTVHYRDMTPEISLPLFEPTR
jgi:uncharacterized OB-fold protein